MNNLDQWATKHHVSFEALEELKQLFLNDSLANAIEDQIDSSETAISHCLRIQASEQGWRLWRNNVGAGKLQNGRFMRWGLCNDNEQINSKIKSADLIGIKPILITPGHVGQTIGQFVSREVKARGWSYKGTSREHAQVRWCKLVKALGGDASITTGEL
jgi:hypothetical protein